MECARAAWCWCAPLVLLLLSTLATRAAAGPRYSSRIVHTHAGAIRGIIVEPASRRLEPVEVFLGVPYAGRPQRLAPPPPAAPWSGTRLADAFAPVCPQRFPDVNNKSSALATMPLGLYNEVRAAVPALVNQTEDCLFLNIYVPGSASNTLANTEVNQGEQLAPLHCDMLCRCGCNNYNVLCDIRHYNTNITGKQIDHTVSPCARGVEAPYAVVVWAGGPSHEWGSGNIIDGSVLAARAHLLVITLNYRLGLLGYLTSGVSTDPVQLAGGAALFDVLAALSWVRRDIAAFGGDPRRVTLAGHAAGAALANTILMMPEIKGLVSRVLLLSGSALSSNALTPDATLAREHTAQALRCVPDPSGDQNWFVECIRARPLPALLAVEAPRARFLAGWGPSVPTTRGIPPQSPTRALHASEPFLECALAVVVSTTESYQFFSEDDIKHGFEEEHRNRVLRTYVRNVYRYHRNEIYAAIRNEYTDWEKPIQHPINIRDATLESLSDAAVCAPALRLAQLHARRGADTHLAHLAHQTRDAEYPQRLGSVTSDTLPYFLGLPLVGGAPANPRNYSRSDVAVAESAVALLAAFANTGNPTPRHDSKRHESPVSWPRYEINNQQYLSIGTKLRVKSHYRGHKMALWLHLIPQLHRPGAAPRHHQFRSVHPDMFAVQRFDANGDLVNTRRNIPGTVHDDDDSGRRRRKLGTGRGLDRAGGVLAVAVAAAGAVRAAGAAAHSERGFTHAGLAVLQLHGGPGSDRGRRLFPTSPERLGVRWYLSAKRSEEIYSTTPEERRQLQRPHGHRVPEQRPGGSDVAAQEHFKAQQRVRVKRETEQRRSAKKTRTNTRDIRLDEF